MDAPVPNNSSKEKSYTSTDRASEAKTGKPQGRLPLFKAFFGMLPLLLIPTLLHFNVFQLMEYGGLSHENLRWKRLQLCHPSTPQNLPDGKTLYQARWSNMMSVDNEGNRERLATFGKHSNPSGFLEHFEALPDEGLLSIFSNYQGSHGESVVVFDKEFEPLAALELQPRESASMCAKAAMVVVTNHRGKAVARDLELRELWTYQTPVRPGRVINGDMSATAFSKDELYVLDGGSTLVRLDPATGKALWESSKHRIDAQDVLKSADGSIRVVAQVNRVVSYDPDGRELWSQNFYSGEQQWDSLTALSPAGNTYFCQNRETLHMLTPDGRTLWDKPLPGKVRKFASGFEDRIYVLFESGELSCYSADSELLWTADGIHWPVFGPHINKDGSVLVGGSRRLYCFEP